MNNKTNQLINEDSPYLKQHSLNPVEWYTWGKEALKRAKNEDKLIFLSIGYSTCHWCHVMERESFENEEIADILNQDYISIKVDREERPDIDKYYQDIHMLVRRRGGGWPLSVVMTPEKKVVYIATYIPPSDRYNMVGMKKLCFTLAKDFKIKKEEFNKIGENIQNAVDRYNKSEKNSALSVDVSRELLKDINNAYDRIYGGIGDKPKFPQASLYPVVLNLYKLNSNPNLLEFATHSLKAMANGGINDQIEGGFYRYSVDEKWIIPHFEKMLYTNAELILVYTEAYLLSKDEKFKEVVFETINNINERFKINNLFLSASDADSDHEEGKYFVFEYEEIFKELSEVFDTDKAKEICNYFNITKEGNFENQTSNPFVTNDKLNFNIKKAKEILFKNRQKRNYPFIDDKIQTSWNALMITALFNASKIDISFAKEAITSLDTLLEELLIEEVLYHQKLTNKKPKVKAFLEDYAFLIESLIKAYQFNFDEKYLNLANRLCQEAIKKFYKEEKWLISDSDFISYAPMEDSAYKSAVCVMIENLFYLASLFDDLELNYRAKEMLNLNLHLLNKSTLYFPTLANVYFLDKFEIKIIKANKKNLIKSKNQIESINYPFIVKKAVKELDNFMLCGVGSCYFEGESLEEIIKLNLFC